MWCEGSIMVHLAISPSFYTGYSVAQYGTIWHNMAQYGTVAWYMSTALGVLWRVTCSWGPGQTNAGAKSIFRCEENLNAPRRWWAPSPSSDLLSLSENQTEDNTPPPDIPVLWFKAYTIEDLDKMCWTFAPYGRLRRTLGPCMASCIWYLFVFVFLVTGISLDHMVGRVRGLGPIMVTCSILL